MSKFFFSIFIILLGISAQAQTLVNIGSLELSVPEFLWAYNKGNALGKPSGKNDIRSYLNMYINFKLKVIDAEAMGLDKKKSFIDEISSYRTRLAERFLLEREVSDKLVLEAYSRSLKLINASHILILCSSNASPADTLVAYQKISRIKKLSDAGQDFEELATQFSEELGASEVKGLLGDFTVFEMSYPFESTAYNTPKGEVSQITRTRFGYHLIKVNDVKDNPGQIEIAHILISTKPADADKESQAKAVEIYKQLLQGANFELMARQFSDDTFTSETGGVLQIMNFGKSDKKLEAAAFALNKPGEISAPVYTPYGWHIIKLIRKIPIPPLQLVKTQLVNRVAADERSLLGEDYFIERLKKQNNFYEDNSLKNKHEVLMEKLASADKNGEDLLFSINKEKVVLNDFLKFLVLHKTDGQSPEYVYKQFVKMKLIAHEDQHLEEKYADFKYLLNEYREGTLLFNVSEIKIWNHTPSDSVKLMRFYNSRSTFYSWKERADTRIYMVNSVGELEVLKGMQKHNMGDEGILKEMNKSNPINLIINSGKFERGTNPFLDRAKWESNLDSEVKIGNAIALVKISRILPPVRKSISEVQDVLLTDYEKYLEEEWLKDLKAKYPITINQAQLRKINR